jgi:hypothetical protein
MGLSLRKERIYRSNTGIGGEAAIDREDDPGDESCCFGARKE